MLKFNQCEELDARFGNQCFNKRSMKFTVLWHKYLPGNGESCHTDPQMSPTIPQLHSSHWHPNKAGAETKNPEAFMLPSS